MKKSLSRRLFLGGLVALIAFAAQVAQAGPIAFVYNTAGTTTAANFKSFLDGRGYATTLFDVSGIVATTDFSTFDTIIIGDETGYLNEWAGSMAPAASILQVGVIDGSGRPMVGIGEGGYAFFSKLGQPNGWPYGWHGPQSGTIAVNPADPLFGTPNLIPLDASNAVQLFTADTNAVGIYGLAPFVMASTLELLGREPGLDPGNADHYDLSFAANRYFLWGYSDDPTKMTAAGKDLFENVIARACVSVTGQPQCSGPTVPAPASLYLLATGLAGVAARRWRKKG
ncbi:MAG: PEP-CTERM sorting domain-containing protein [Gammaproteobacteria bacterium]